LINRVACDVAHVVQTRWGIICWLCLSIETWTTRLWTRNLQSQSVRTVEEGLSKDEEIKILVDSDFLKDG
jgi:hypothetical protein